MATKQIMVKEIIDSCWECPHCEFESFAEGECFHSGAGVGLKDVAELPEWCPLEDYIDEET